MKETEIFEVIIVGGSYSGLSAALALGRSLRKVLVIDNGRPCNFQSPLSHNFLTHDGIPPAQVIKEARENVAKYENVSFVKGLALSGIKTESGFEITLEDNKTFASRKLIFASGVLDIMPEIPGFAECWGKSILHCPYCHGYEVRNQKTGILLNGELGYQLAKMISNWTDDLTIYTNGIATFSEEQRSHLKQNNITIVEKEILRFDHEDGKISEIIFEGLSSDKVSALYAHPVIVQRCPIPLELGCEFNEHGLITIDPFHKTSVEGIYACGDIATLGRSVANAVAGGSVAGAFLNKEMIEEDF